MLQRSAGFGAVVVAAVVAEVAAAVASATASASAASVVAYAAASVEARVVAVVATLGSSVYCSLHAVPRGTSEDLAATGSLGGGGTISSGCRQDQCRCAGNRER